MFPIDATSQEHASVFSARRLGILAAFSFLIIAALAISPRANAVTLSFSGSSEFSVIDDEFGEEIGALFLSIDGSFDYDPTGAENPSNPGEYVGVASNPSVTISLDGIGLIGGNSPEQDALVENYALNNFGFLTTFDFVNGNGDQNDIGEAFVSPNDLFFNFPSNPGNNTLALLEVLSVSISPLDPFNPATLAGATQTLLAAPDPNAILLGVSVSYAGPVLDGAPLDNDQSLDFENVAITIVPVPAAVWLFGSGLALLGWVRRRSL
jgi:hypothetical protein